MHSSKFFKFFPPPKYLLMKYAGLEINDDAIRCLEFDHNIHGQYIKKHGLVKLPDLVMDGGEIKNEQGLIKVLHDFEKEQGLGYVKVSVPEEKAYLFQTDIPDADNKSIVQNIEFKIEENVPLSAADAIFYFDIMPRGESKQLRASVSVVPRVYIEKLMEILRESHIEPIAFEVVPKAMSRAVIPSQNFQTVMLIHIMNKKAGIYVVSSGVVCFSSTLSKGNSASESDVYPLIIREAERVYHYWLSHGISGLPIKEIVIVGGEAPKLEPYLQKSFVDKTVKVKIANVWVNVFSFDQYIPAISKEESLDYSVVAGLAMNS